MKKNLDDKKNKVIALCMGGIDAQYQSVIIHEITQRFLGTNFKLLLFQSFSNNYNGDNYNMGDFNIYNLINYNMIDAVIISYLSIKRPQSITEICDKAKEHNLPIIIIDGYVEGAYNITLGYNTAISILTDHVIEKHHATRINFIGGASNNDISNDRERAYKKSLEAHGIPVEEKRIGYGFFWNEPAKQYVKEYYEKYHEMPQAFICANDSMAIGVCQQVQEMGLNVPNDVIVTGLDGIIEAINYVPKITTAKYNFKEISNTVFNVLSDYFNGVRENCVEDIIVESEIVYASSCGCCKTNYNLDNQLKRDLYSKIDFYNAFSASLNNMIERVSGASSLEDTIFRLNHYILKIWSDKVWFCLNESYLNDENSYTTSTSTSNFSYNSKTYELNSNCVIYRCNDKCTSLGLFKTSKLLPCIEEEFKNTNNAIMFCPLFSQENTIGYIALTYTSNFNDNLFKYCNFLKNMVILLENSRIQSELKHTVQKLENMYIRDSMTSIYNRRGFYQLVPALINECMLSDKYLMVLSVDLDGLKPINDIYGHNEGDNAIVTVAKTLNSIAINNEIVSRFGGDEYVVAGVCENPVYAQNYVNRLNDCLNYYNENSNKPYKISASAGIYCTKVTIEDKIQIDDLIKIADETMYNQKQSKHYNRGR